MNYPKHILAVGSLVRNKANQILLVKTERRGWELPGGQVEEGEDLISALQREVREEGSVNIKVFKLVAIYSSIDEPSKLIIDFISEYSDGIVKAADEILEAGWFSEKDAKAKVKNVSMAYRLEWLLAHKIGVRYSYFSKTPFKSLSEIIF